jgi:hypothetical protein
MNGKVTTLDISRSPMGDVTTQYIYHTRIAADTPRLRNSCAPKGLAQVANVYAHGEHTVHIYARESS